MKFFRNRYVKVLVTALFLAALLGADTLPLVQDVHAVTQEDIDNLEKDADDLAKERQEVKSQLAQIRNDKSKAIQVRNLLDQQIALTEREIANTESQIAGFDALLSQTAYELAENEKKEQAQYQLFCDRARLMERNGTPSFWSVLFNANSFSDLLSRLNDVQMVLDYDQQIMDELNAIRDQIKVQQGQQEELKAAAEAAKLKLEEQKADLAQQREDANQLVQQIRASEEEYAEALQQIEDEEERIQKEIVKKTEELAIQMGWTNSVGGYIWPVTSSRRITSPMGSRFTGIPGASTNHKGVDIGGVGYNSKVLATKSGVVITSKYSSSYGNYVVVSHGRGNTTLYAHMSSRSVKEGDVVTQGQVLGISGSTGISNGPHVHYEITENGQRVNPLDYLPGYIKAW